MLKVYIKNLNIQTEGEWVELPISEDELIDVLNKIGLEEDSEEYFIADTDSNILGLTEYINKYDSIETLNEIAEAIDNLYSDDMEILEAMLELGIYSSLEDYVDNIDNWSLYGDVITDYDLGYMLIEEIGCFDIPEELICYIDYERFGRDYDINASGGFTTHGYLWGDY